MEITVSSPVVQRFIDALHTVDAERRTDDIAALASPDASVLSIDGHGPRRGPDGMAALFTQYLDQFDEVSTTFSRATEAEGRAVLEWSSEVTLKAGPATTYAGVTVLEFDDDVVTDFTTIYDSGALLLPKAD